MNRNFMKFVDEYIGDNKIDGYFILGNVFAFAFGLWLGKVLIVLGYYK